MRRAVALLVLVALAGCSGGGRDGPNPQVEADAASRDAATLGTPEPASGGAAVTDTLFLAPPARLNTTNPQNLTILAQISGAFAQAFGWNTTLNGTGNLTSARMAVWVDLQNSAVQAGIGGDPGCSAALTLVFYVNGTAVSQPGGCASLGTGLIEPGEHLLEFAAPMTSAPAAGLPIRPGDEVTAIVSFGFTLPQGVGYVLGGGDHPSSLRLAGLVEPVRDGAALL